MWHHRPSVREGTAGGVLHMLPQAPLAHPSIAILANALLAALNRLRLAPAALLGDLANALDASLAKAFGTLLEAPRVEARGAATAFLQLWVPFVRKELSSMCMDLALGMCRSARHCKRW